MWCFRSFSPPDGCAYGDKECLRERSEESGEEGLASGPRTRLFRIILYVNILQKLNVRGPFTEERLNVRGKASTGEKGP